MVSESWFQPTNFSGIFKRSYNFFRAYFLQIMRLTLLIMVPMQIVSMIAGRLVLIEGTLSLVGWTLMIITAIGGKMLLAAAIICISLDILLGTPSRTIGSVLKEATQYVTPLLLIDLTVIVVAGIIATFGALIVQLFAGGTQSEIIQSTQLFLFMIAFFIIYPRMFLAPFFIINEQAKVLESLRKSVLLTNLNRPIVVVVFLGYLLLNLIVLWLNMAQPVLALIAVMFVMPFSVLMLLFLYISLRMNQEDFRTAIENLGKPNPDEGNEAVE